MHSTVASASLIEKVPLSKLTEKFVACWVELALSAHMTPAVSPAQIHMEVPVVRVVRKKKTPLIILIAR